jgi:hypothetical protein
MKKYLILLLFLPSLAYSQPQTCAVTGTFYNFDGSLADSVKVTVVRVYDSTGAIIHSKPIAYTTGGSMSGALRGVVQFNIIRNTVACISARAMGWDIYGPSGKCVGIPDAASGILSSFVTPDSVPSTQVVIIPTLFVTDTTGDNSASTDTLKVGSGLAVEIDDFGSPILRATATGGSGGDYGDSIRIADSLARVALSTAQGIDGSKWDQTGTRIEPKSGIDTVRLLDEGGETVDVTSGAYGRKIIKATNEVELASTWGTLVTSDFDVDIQSDDINLTASEFIRLRPTYGTYIKVGSNGDEWITGAIGGTYRGLRINASGNIKVGPGTYSIRPQLFDTQSAYIDSLYIAAELKLAHLAGDTTGRVLKIGADGIVFNGYLPAAATPDTTGYFARYGGVMTESDPTATAKAQVVVSDTIGAAFTDGPLSISSTGRIFAAMDSITFLGEAGDVIDLSLGNNFRGTLSQNDTLSFTGGVDGQVGQIVITNANNYTLAFTGIAWPAGTAPTITAVANKRTIISYLVSGGMIHGVSVLNY